jgi:hypothetical protein
MKEKIKKIIPFIIAAIAVTAAQIWGASTFSTKILWQFYLLGFIPGLFPRGGDIAPGETITIGFHPTLMAVAFIGGLLFGIILYSFLFFLMIEKFRIFLRVIGGLLVLPVVLYLVVLLGNLRDADLLPEVESLMKDRPPQMVANDNGYFAWIGIMGPADQPAHAWGYRWFQAVTDRERELRWPESFGYLPIQSEIRHESIAGGAASCEEIKSCLEDIAAAAPEAALELLNQHRIILERGDQALSFPAFQEAWRPDFSSSSPFPPFPLKWNRLAAIRFSQEVADGQHDKALAELGREISFHTRFLEGSYSIINKMIGVRNLGYCYSLLSQYMQREPAAARERLGQIRALLAPPPTVAVNLRAAILNEQRFNTRLLLAIKEHPDYLKGTSKSKLLNWLSNRLSLPLMLPKTSANELTAFYHPLILAEEIDGKDYRNVIARLQFTAKANKHSFLKWRNPVGHILGVVALPDFSNYFLRRDDLLALRRLVFFQALLLQQGPVDGAAVTSMLATTAVSDLEHPYFGTRAAWDEKRRLLFFPVTGGKLPAGDAKPVAIQL